MICGRFRSAKRGGQSTADGDLGRASQREASTEGAKDVPTRARLTTLLEIGAKCFDRFERFLGHLFSRDVTIDAAEITAERC